MNDDKYVLSEEIVTYIESGEWLISGDTEYKIDKYLGRRVSDKLVINYLDSSGVVTEREIETNSVTLHYENSNLNLSQCYIEAFCHLRNGNRTFSFTRIVSACSHSGQKIECLFCHLNKLYLERIDLEKELEDAQRAEKKYLESQKLEEIRANEKRNYRNDGQIYFNYNQMRNLRRIDLYDIEYMYIDCESNKFIFEGWIKYYSKSLDRLLVYVNEKGHDIEHGLTPKISNIQWIKDKSTGEHHTEVNDFLDARYYLVEGLIYQLQERYPTFLRAINFLARHKSVFSQEKKQFTYPLLRKITETDQLTIEHHQKLFDIPLWKSEISFKRKFNQALAEVGTHRRETALELLLELSEKNKHVTSETPRLIIGKKIIG